MQSKSTDLFLYDRDFGHERVHLFSNNLFLSFNDVFIVMFEFCFESGFKIMIENLW